MLSKISKEKIIDLKAIKMNERKLLTGIIVFVVIIIGGILAFTPGFMLFGVQKNEPLKIGLVVWPGFGPYYVAQEKAFFDKLIVQ